MPIPVAQLHEARRPLRERILEFLSKNPTQAYSALEVFVGLEGWSEIGAALAILLLERRKPPTPGTMVEVQDALTMLETEGLVQSAPHLSLQYYAIRPR